MSEGERPTAEVVPIAQEKKMRELEARGYTRQEVAWGDDRESLLGSKNNLIAGIGGYYPALTEFFVVRADQQRFKLIALVPPQKEPGPDPTYS